LTEFLCESYLQGLEHLRWCLCKLPYLIPMTKALASVFIGVASEISREISETKAGTFKHTLEDQVHTHIPWFHPIGSTTSSSTSLGYKPSSSEKCRCDYSEHANGSSVGTFKTQKQKVTGETPHCHQWYSHTFTSQANCFDPQKSQITIKGSKFNVGLCLLNFGLENEPPTTFFFQSHHFLFLPFQTHRLWQKYSKLPISCHTKHSIN
ncbi:hypothetical protein DFH28DRAFT_896189, partial [Melampsora americana]